MAGFLKDAMPGLLAAGIGAITRGGPRRQYKWNKRAAQDAYEMNRVIQEEQRAYDSPRAQMDRFIAAGLNPNMIYGGGSASSGGTFPFSYDVAPPSAQFPDVSGMYLQAQQTRANTNLASQRTAESEQKTALLAIQEDIAKTNPMLNPAVYKSLTSSMIEVADAKAKEAHTTWMMREKTTETSFERYTLGAKKIEAQVEAMVQKLGLNTADLKIRNEILESKEFQNVILEIQSAWLKDAEVTPQHVWQGLMLILQRMMK